MRIGLISDTHDRLDAMDAALEWFRGAGIDTLIHPGDVIAPFAAKRLAAFGGRLFITYGNNDGERAGLMGVLPQIQNGPLWVELEGRRILVHHFIDWCAPADVAAADVVVTGHTHEAGVERVGGKLLVNPGECCGWVTGRRTIGVLDLERMTVELREVAI